MTRKVPASGMICFVQGVAANGNNGIGSNNGSSSTNNSSSSTHSLTSSTQTTNTTSMVVHRNNERNVVLSKQISVVENTKAKRGVLQKSR